MDTRVQKVIEVISKNLDREWPLDRLAGSVHLSPSRLHQIFKDETGTSPSRYLRGLRMRHARELLETTFLSVKEIKARVGFGDDSHFVRDFKKLYGLSPAQYRARARNGHYPTLLEPARRPASEISDDVGAPARACPLCGNDREATASRPSAIRVVVRQQYSALIAAASAARYLAPTAVTPEKRNFRPQPQPLYRPHPRFAHRHRPGYVAHAPIYTIAHRAPDLPRHRGSYRPFMAASTPFVAPARRVIDPHAHPT